jgi:hypothetical protein
MTGTYYVVQNTQTGEYLRRYALGHKKLYSKNVNSNTFRGKKEATVLKYLETVKTHLGTLGRVEEANSLQLVTATFGVTEATNLVLEAQAVNS